MSNTDLSKITEFEFEEANIALQMLTLAGPLGRVGVTPALLDGEQRVLAITVYDSERGADVPVAVLIGANEESQAAGFSLFDRLTPADGEVTIEESA